MPTIAQMVARSSRMGANLDAKNNLKANATNQQNANDLRGDWRLVSFHRESKRQVQGTHAADANDLHKRKMQGTAGSCWQMLISFENLVEICRIWGSKHRKISKNYNVCKISQNIRGNVRLYLSTLQPRRKPQDLHAPRDLHDLKKHNEQQIETQP